ncbi:conserved hypothetical protein [Sporisorium reilianum SRZ2]|uniref:Uncharacterized protein n=1 Tax=Sporisorium reilianum (strain SRZ2) TaxID=999809 RepID=E6ZVU9_SPORE|nr:conserved hypothetical protein [Sporisorium reilianum SRZ2]
MQAQRMRLAPLSRRQVNPAAFSGVTDQISSVGSAAGSKAAHATSGLTRTQTFMVVVMCLIGCVLAVAALFWVCSVSRRRKRAREMRDKSQRLDGVVTVDGEAGFVLFKRGSRHLGMREERGWGESTVALNSSFGASNGERDGWRQDRVQPAMPQTPQQTYRF